MVVDDIPADVREYLLAGDGLGIVTVIEKHPGVEARLKTPAVQAALYRYLGSEAPWNEQVPVLAMAALDNVLATPTPEGAKSIRRLTGHPNPLVRVRAYRYLFALVYPRDREGMAGVIEEMLNDRDESVRLEAARLVKNMKLVDEMREYLRNWVRLAPERQWNHGESYNLLEGLAKQ